MPYVRIQLKSGRTEEQKAKLAKEIIDLMEETDFAKRDAIRVIFEDMLPHDLYSGAEI
ncbi:tautomerase family protein [Fundicoccus ignavus]|uniref:4-oxalocrotonate tautomerase n=1 Tax=Fundicoccus ignavus TaxID=2664442 RepID=A0A6I2GC26_9LACT|nr:tautomerase family protein [Fundicoccus ignavus]MRI85310.1 4-oxalocrotonate tautomerase [Fundicoccus ignavus]MRJ48084.1 4-oxalocrotonate tautomerase [Fundicoccus ignavus]